MGQEGVRQGVERCTRLFNVAHELISASPLAKPYSRSVEEKIRGSPWPSADKRRALLGVMSLLAVNLSRGNVLRNVNTPIKFLEDVFVLSVNAMATVPRAESAFVGRGEHLPRQMPKCSSECRTNAPFTFISSPKSLHSQSNPIYPTNQNCGGG
jgi:hypothetical protein